jgi:predicted outer membrane lipoprotein
MNKVINFGETVEGYNIPMLNEREIRAAAGILFLMMFISILTVVFKGDFLPLKCAVTIFLTDILIRVFINPKFSPFLILGRLIVRNQVPDYVGAPQKKFAWIIGVLLAAAIFIHLVILNAHSLITGIICLICLVFLFFETAFGICLGCKFYAMFYKEKAQYCPGEVCDVKSKKSIQKTSRVQILIVFGFIIYIFLMIFLFNSNFSKQPYDLFGIENSISSSAN